MQLPNKRNQLQLPKIHFNPKKIKKTKRKNKNTKNKKKRNENTKKQKQNVNNKKKKENVKRKTLQLLVKHPKITKKILFKKNTHTGYWDKTKPIKKNKKLQWLKTFQQSTIIVFVLQLLFCLCH